MPRSTVSVGDLDFLRTHDLVKIILTTGETFWLGSARVEATDPTTGSVVEFQPYITNVGECQQSYTLAADKIPLTIHNIDKVFGLLINDPESQLAGAKCYFIKYFQNLDTFATETKIVMRGEIADVKTNEQTVNFTLLASLAVGQATLGGQPIQPNCPLTFGGRECGWTEAQGGPPTYCDKQYLSPNGCSGHANQFRFQGIVVGGDITEPVFNPGGGLDGGDNTNRCFLDDTYITLGSGETKTIDKINVGDEVLSHNTKLQFNINVVTATQSSLVTTYYRVKFSDSEKITNVVPSHPFLNAKLEWKRVDWFSVGDSVVTAQLGLAKIDLLELVTLDSPVTVYNFTVENDHTYVADGKLVHNTKPIYDPPIFLF